jgi:hypothetical protein
MAFRAVVVDVSQNFPPGALAIRVLDHVLIIHWFLLGQTRARVGAPAVMTPPDVLVKSHVRGPKGEARPDLESSRHVDSESGLRFPALGM